MAQALGQQIGGKTGFGEIVGGPGLHQLDCDQLIAVACQNDDRRGNPARLGFPENRKAVGVGKLEVQQNRVKRLLRHPVQCLLAALGFGDFAGQAGRRQRPPGSLPVKRVVVYD